VRTRAAVTPVMTVTPASEIDWNAIGFGLTTTSHMFKATCELGGEWKVEGVVPYGDLSLSPAAAVLNYGQGVFEGMKAFRTVEDELLVFRPDENAARCEEGAGRMSMPAVPRDLFQKAVLQTVSANADYVPPVGMGSLYLRPLLIGTGAILGLGPAPSYTFLVYCSPVASYFKGGQLTPIDLTVEETYHRAAPGGSGSTKCIGNYSPVLKVQLEAKNQGFSDVMYLDAKENKYIEEVSSCNFFCVKGKKISTPSLQGTILPGITRKSICELAAARGFTVEERPVSIEEVMDADECFCTGTAVVVAPVGSVTFRGKKTTFSNGEVGPTSQMMYDQLTGIQQGKLPDERGWNVKVPKDYHLEA
jgi:branched-chain amino acid aminotransferase